MQKRLVRKLDLEIALSKIEPHPSPKAYLEQYTIPPEVAAELLYIAAYTYDDIIDKTIADLGCGTGRLAIGSALLGAKETIGVHKNSGKKRRKIRRERENSMDNQRHHYNSRNFRHSITESTVWRAEAKG